MISLKPKSGFSHILHLTLTALLPALVFVLVRMHFVPMATAVILLSKWRMLAVRPRYWIANLRANAVDIMFGLSIVIFMSQANAASWQLAWAFVYGLWLVLIKPGNSTFKVTLQACLVQFFALSALFLQWGAAPRIGLVLASWLGSYLIARHFFSSFDEPYAALYAHTWGYFAGALVWLLSHWLLFYSVIAQPTMLLAVIGYGLATLYYLEQTDRLNIATRRQFVFIMTAVIVVVLVFSDWGDKAVK